MSSVRRKAIAFFCGTLFFSLCGCASVQQGNLQQVVKACKSDDQKGKVICKGLTWLSDHPVDIKTEGFLELGEELNLYYRLFLKTDDRREKGLYKQIITSKIDYLLNAQDLKVEYAGEITGYLNFEKIMKRLDIVRPSFSEFIEKDVLVNPMTYPPNVTYTILNTALIEDIGVTPRLPLSALVGQGIVAHFARHPELVPIGKAYASPDDVMNFYYDITHEIFAVSNFGDRDPRESLFDEEIQFLNRIIPQGIATYIEAGQVDILGELIVCAKMLRYTDFQGFESGIQCILDAQKEDGSFGRIERMVYLGRPNVYRHGVLVVLWALVE